MNYPAVSITSNKITSLTKDLSKRAIICRIGAKIDNERGAKNSKRVNESMSELTTAFYGEYVRRMLVCIDEMTTEMRENANGKEYFPDIFHASSSVIADELPNSLEAEISGGNQLIMNYEQAQELFGIKFRRWLGIFNL